MEATGTPSVASPDNYTATHFELLETIAKAVESSYVQLMLPLWKRVNTKASGSEAPLVPRAQPAFQRHRMG